jgi:hypothetical protein
MANDLNIESLRKLLAIAPAFFISQVFSWLRLTCAMGLNANRQRH